MRSFISGLLTFIAMVAVVLAVPAMWVDQRLVDEDGFVSLVEPMAQNQQVKDYLVDEITAQAAARVDSLGSGVLASTVEAVVRPVARKYTESEGFAADFEDLVRQQHSWLFDEAKPGSDNQEMQVDITAMVNRVVRQAVPGAPTITGPVVVPLNDGGTGLEAGRYHRAGQQINTLAVVTLIVTILAALGALLVAVRRGTVLAWLGAGVVASGVSAWAVAGYLGNRAKDQVSTAEESRRQVADLFIDRCAEDLTELALIVGGVGVAIVVVGVVLRLVFPRAF